MEPMLREGEVDYEVVRTQYKGHAKDFIRELNILYENWDAIITLSGDGVIHEIINGLMSRDDFHSALQLPIGIVPCGTGNTAISNILNYRRELFSPINATFIFIRALHCGFKSSNIANIINVNDELSYSFIGIYYGISPTVVIRTQPLRFLGPLRYILGLLWYGMKGERFRAKLTYVPYGSEDNQPVVEIIDCLNFTSLLMPYLMSDTLLAPEHRMNSDYFSLSIIENEVGYFRLFRNYANRKNSPHLKDPRYRILQVKEFLLEPMLPVNYILTDDGDQIISGRVKCEMTSNHIKFLV